MKLMNGMKKFSLSFCILTALIFSAALPGNAQMHLAPSDKRIAAQEQFKPTANRRLLEARKIQYLITLVSLSPYSFVRNGKAHTSKEAASHLRFKYGKSGGRIETARQFIEYVASKSMLTGQPYLLETVEGARFPINDLLENELEFLEQKIEAQ